jgi:hypothetical protein
MADFEFRFGLVFKGRLFALSELGLCYCFGSHRFGLVTDADGGCIPVAGTCRSNADA